MEEESSTFLFLFFFSMLQKWRGKCCCCCCFCYYQRNLFTLETFSSRIPNPSWFFLFKYFTGFCWPNAKQSQTLFCKPSQTRNIFTDFYFERRTFEHCCQSCVKTCYIQPPPHRPLKYISLRRQSSTYNSLSVSPFSFKLNILVFYLLFCLKVYERWNSWTTSVHFYMALHLFLYVWLPWILFFLF